VGLKADKPINQVDSDQLEQLAVLADEAMEGVVVLNADLDLYRGDNVWSTLMSLFSRIPARDHVAKAVETVLNLERIPSIPSLILNKVLSLEDIVTIRHRRETEEFRNWLWSQPSPEDAEAVSKSYLSAMAPDVNVKDRTWFKTSRISAIGVVGGVLGTIAAGPIGGVTGAAISTGAGIAVSLVDGLLLDRIKKGNNPRKLSTDILGPRVAAASMNPQKSRP
jgi:hypothetical protein